jgi:hypothetical protein
MNPINGLKKKVITCMTEFQWIYQGNYDPISDQFEEFVKDCDFRNDPNFKVTHMSVVTAKNSDKKVVETMYLIFTCTE